MIRSTSVKRFVAYNAKVIQHKDCFLIEGNWYNSKLPSAHFNIEMQENFVRMQEVIDCVCVLSVPPVVEVLEPPFNSPLQERVANQRIAFPCPAKGTVLFVPTQSTVTLTET